MNAKLVLIGGLVFWLMTWVVSMVTGPIIHDGMLMPAYRELSGFWRPALMETPPDMASLMPRWITTGLVLSFVFAILYGLVRPAIAGNGWLRGAKYGLGVFALVAAVMASWTGIFNLPDRLWVWWGIEALAVYVIGGAVMGWAVDRWVPLRRGFA
jgi:hypothetical protein